MNNKLITNYESRVTSREPRGFTLIEIVVAIAILAMVIAFAGIIFKNSIGAYRISSAQAEIMQKLRVITEQLDGDFKGLRKDAPMFIWFQQDSNDPCHTRYDQIMFFADGDFQSAKQYAYTKSDGTTGLTTIVGNTARIRYAQSQIYSPSLNAFRYPWLQNMDNYYDRSLTKRQRILARSQHIFAYNFPPVFPQFAAGNLLTIDPNANNLIEYDSNSLAQWKSAAQFGVNTHNIITGCFGDAADNFNFYRPWVNLSDPNTLHLLMTQGVGSLSIQWSYQYSSITGQNKILWWPAIDPDGNGNFADSDFASMAQDSFGFYFNAAQPSPSLVSWLSSDRASGVYYPGAAGNLVTAKPAFPPALKFTFKLYDSRGVFKDGQTFTHIVYLGD